MDEVKINKLDFCGLKNVVLVINGTGNINTDEFKILFKDKELKFIVIDKNTNYFNIKCKISNSIKKVNVFYKDKLICSKKNYFINRLSNKLFTMLKNITNYINNIFFTKRYFNPFIQEEYLLWVKKQKKEKKLENSNIIH